MTRANPHRFPDEWGRVYLSNWLVPAILVAVNGAKLEDEWAVQRGIGTTGAVTIWRGTKPVEGLVLTFDAPDEERFDSLYDLYGRLEPKPGKRPPTLSIRNPIINFIKVDRVCRKSWEGPRSTSGLGWQVDLGLIQYKPPIIIPAGPADPAKLPAEPTPVDAAEAAIKSLQAQVASLL